MSAIVFKILKAGASFHALDYNARKERTGQARLVHMGNFGVLQDGRTTADPKDLKRYLERFAERNSRIRQPQFHAIMSCKGHTLGFEELTRQALVVMGRLGYADNPIAIYAHSDTRNRHIHIITTRVGIDGRKINDRFEGLRSNRILTEMLGVDTVQACQKALTEALGYRFSSLRQFQLLMELRGYRARRELGEIYFFRHGNRQGSVAISLLEKRIVDRPMDASHKARVRGVLLANQDGLDRTLVNRSNTRGKVELGSEFTDHMHRRFGLQFVFFSAAGHQRPYGYVIIDHGKKMVHKGGDILRLGFLTGEAVGEEKDKRERRQESGEGRRGVLPVLVDDAGSILVMMDELVRQVEEDAKRDVKGAENMARRKRGKKR